MIFPPLIILWLFGLTNGLLGRATAIPQFNTSDCVASCTVRPPRVESVGWKKVEASTRTTIAAFTVVAIINTQQNLTRYTTKTAQLPEGYTIPPTNENGTRLCVIKGSETTDQPVTLPFPTFRRSTDSIYDWYGQLPTTVSNATNSACLSTSTFATFHNHLPISQYIPNDITISDDPYGLNYECTSLDTVAGQIYTTEDEAAFRSCDTFTNTETTYYSTGYLETAAWLTIASSTSYEMASQASTSDKSISPAPHSIMAPQTTTVHSSKSSSPYLERSYNQPASTAGPKDGLDKTASSAQSSISHLSHITVTSENVISIESPKDSESDSDVFHKGSQLSYLQSTVKTNGFVPSKSTPTLGPTLDSDSEHTDFPYPSTSQALAASVNAGGAKPSQLASTEVGQTVKASLAPAQPSAGGSSLAASSGIEGLNSGSSPIATTSLSTSTMYSTSFRTSVTTDEQGSMSEVIETEKVSVGITVVLITSAGIPAMSAAGASNPAGLPSVPTLSGIQSTTSTPTSFGEGSGSGTGEGGSTSATTDASRSETQTEMGASQTGVPAWNSATKADYITGYGLIFVWFGLLLAS